MIASVNRMLSWMISVMSCNVLILLSYTDMDDIPMSETIKKEKKWKATSMEEINNILNTVQL